MRKRNIAEDDDLFKEEEGCDKEEDHDGKEEGREEEQRETKAAGQARNTAHWGRAFRMALTSSATAVRANSNWSYRGRERQHI